jgi:hypothetical protein
MGSLWGEYDEAANASSFKDAVSSFRGAADATGDVPPRESADRWEGASQRAAPAAEKRAKMVCYECMRRFTSAALSCPVTQRKFCSLKCMSAYNMSQPKPLSELSDRQSKSKTTALEQLRAKLVMCQAPPEPEPEPGSERSATTRVSFSNASVESAQGGGSLWGTYDEAANAESFKNAVASFRDVGGSGVRRQQSDTPVAIKASRTACYRCFKLYPLDSGHVRDGRGYCSEACAPQSLAIPLVNPGAQWVPSKGALARYIGDEASLAGMEGVVTRDPDKQGETKLRLQDGRTTRWIHASDLKPVEPRAGDMAAPAVSAPVPVQARQPQTAPSPQLLVYGTVVRPVILGLVMVTTTLYYHGTADYGRISLNWCHCTTGAVLRKAGVWREYCTLQL